MAPKIIRALVTTLCGFLLLYLLQHGSTPDTISSYVSTLADHGKSLEYVNKILRPAFGEPSDWNNLGHHAAKSDEHDSKKSKTKGKDTVMALLSDPVPRRNFSQYAHKPPHKPPGQPPYAYATLLCTRKPDMRDPFFAATQSLVWRLLWSEWHGSYPLIVYVCPFTPEEQRQVLRGQGAIVKEIGLLDTIVPSEKVPMARWLDQFSKLNMWKETEYERIAYLDVDAFPLANIDDVFTVIPEQSCVTSELDQEDRAMMDRDEQAGQAFCNYTFAGVDPYGDGEINGGFLVFKPDMLMYEKLIRGAKRIDEYDLTKMEQGLLHSKLAFGQDGPFKAHVLSPIYNAVPDYYITHRDGNAESADGQIRVIHEKLWSAIGNLDRQELNMRWDLDWIAMCRFYDGEVFEYARETGRLKDKLEVFFDILDKAEAEKD